MVGTVSNMIPYKGFGFISGENGQEYFFHYSETKDWEELVFRFGVEGGSKIQVEFEPTKTPKGPRAKQVTVVEV